MKQLEIFKYNLHFQYWGELYLGCKAQWITPNDVLEFCYENQTKKFNNQRYVSLYLALDESLDKFYEQIKLFIEEDRDLPIIKNEDELNDDLSHIPQIYWNIWEKYFLLKIKENPNRISEKFDQIFSLRVPFNYPTKWDLFLYERPQANGKYLSEQERYQIFLDYLSHL